MKTINSQQEEYRAFLKNIREEREESSNPVKLVITVIMALLNYDRKILLQVTNWNIRN